MNFNTVLSNGKMKTCADPTSMWINTWVLEQAFMCVVYF